MAKTDIMEKDMTKADSVSMVRGLDSNGNSIQISVEELLKVSFQERGNVVGEVDNLVKSGIYGLNKDIYNPNIPNILYGMLLVFSGSDKASAGGGYPSVQIAVDYRSLYVMIRSKWGGFWEAWRSVTIA